MPTLSDTLSPSRRLELAVRTRSPERLALTFAQHVGQFYDRVTFDAMAREAHALYTTDSPERAACFRARLDRRLCDRYHAPVAWDVTPPASTRRAA